MTTEAGLVRGINLSQLGLTIFEHGCITLIDVQSHFLITQIAVFFKEVNAIKEAELMPYFQSTTL